MNICIYSSARDEIDEIYMKETEEIGKALAEAGHTLIFGAGATGLMGASARGWTKGGGEIIGVAPDFMSDFEPAYDKCTELIMTANMADRKTLIEDMSDVFLIFPGGIGTLDEFFQILTLKYLERQNKEIIVFDSCDYYSDLLKYLEKCVEKKFIGGHVPYLYRVAKDKDDVIAMIKDIESREEEN